MFAIDKMAKDIQILMVEDMQSIATETKKILFKNGFYNITHCESAEEAIKLLKVRTFDLILSDWNMRGLTGLDFLKYVKSLPNFKNIPFILLTSEASRDKIVEAIHCGINQYIVKPIKEDVLMVKIHQVFKKI